MKIWDFYFYSNHENKQYFMYKNFFFLVRLYTTNADKHKKHI